MHYLIIDKQTKKLKIDKHTIENEKRIKIFNEIEKFILFNLWNLFPFSSLIYTCIL
jgi:hypothetical protein